ncbi:hypothetical protein ACQEVC_35815 [Plantactinospora sp. CA-294935]|uniref:hypothetical protein n=1 Tax=Plantactinospora sp. CA-294935 TaxID=3240012 RepID=UPI003D914CC9
MTVNEIPPPDQHPPPKHRRAVQVEKGSMTACNFDQATRQLVTLIGVDPGKYKK